MERQTQPDNIYSDEAAVIKTEPQRLRWVFVIKNKKSDIQDLVHHSAVCVCVCESSETRTWILLSFALEERD